ncbi:MAG: hypothetical protein KF764_23625 [Labilithrix sp.]|nr:hypothetical protein [Labilithrix sp.]
MKLWRFADPFDYRFARAGRVGGTWQDGEYKIRARNIVLDWESGSDIVGDFTWPGFDTDLVVTDGVGQALQESGVAGFDLRPVEMQESAEPAKRRSKKSRVKLPYEGPPLWDLWVTAWTASDRELSTLHEVLRDDGSSQLEVVGAQRWERVWDQQRMELVSVLHPRVEGQALVVPKMRGVFRVEEFPAWVFCTDDVKALIENHDFKNVSFLEMGDVLDR